MEIHINNFTFTGRWQWLLFLLLDINDFFGRPFTFVLGKVCFNGLTFDESKLKEGSGKWELGKLLYDIQKNNSNR